MAEQEQVETGPSEVPAKEETLEDVLKDFPVESAAQSFNAQPKQDEAPPEVNIPDPSYDPDGFKAAMKGLTTNDWEVKQTLNRISEQLDGVQKERQRTVEEADISDTVAKIQESVPALAGKDRVVKGYLGAMAQEDPRIARVWENRKQNPGAWNKTLNAISKQVAKDFEFSADPQLTENTRAAKASRDQMATTNKADPNDGIPKDPGAFEHYWNNLVNS